MEEDKIEGKTKPLFKPPFRVERPYKSTCVVLDSNNRLVTTFRAGQARFWEIAEEVSKAMNEYYKKER